MTDFGHILNTIALDPSVIVDLSPLDPSTVVTLATTKTDLIQDPETQNLASGVFGATYVPVGYFEDSGSFKGFAIIPNDHTFEVYRVNGSSAIILDSSTTITLPFSAGGYAQQVLGIKRISSSLYYIYYADYSAPNLVIGRVSVVPRGASSYTVLATYTFPAFDTYTSAKKRIGETCYISVCGIVLATHNYVQAYIYALDMDTETLSGGLVHQSDGSIYVEEQHAPAPGSLGLRMAENSGTLVWALVYMYSIYAASLPDYFRIILNDASVTDIATGVVSPFDTWGCSVTMYQWNGQDSKLVVQLYTGHGVQNATVINGVLQPLTYPVSTLGITPLYSASVFPCLGRDLSNDYWIMDPATGAVSALSIPGVVNIQAIFPVMDTYTQDLYMVVELTGGAVQFVSVNSTTFTIDTVYSLITILSGFPHSFNFGNFFIQNYFDTLYVWYLTNPVPVASGLVMEWF